MRTFCLSSFSCWSLIRSIRSSMRLFWASSISWWINKTKVPHFQYFINFIPHGAPVRKMGPLRFRTFLRHQQADARINARKQATCGISLESLLNRPQTHIHPSVTSICSFQPTAVRLCNSLIARDFPSLCKAFQAHALLHKPLPLCHMASSLQVVKSHSCVNLFTHSCSWCLQNPLCGSL